MRSNIIWIFVLVKVAIAKSFPLDTESSSEEPLTSALEADEDKIEAVQPDYSTTIGSLPPDSMSRAKVI